MAMKLLSAGLVTAIALVALASPAAAQIINFSVNPSTFTYPSADPDSSPVVKSPTLLIAYKLSGRPRAHWTVTIQAQSDLLSGTSSIPAGNVSWTATPAPFVNGTLSTSAQTLAAGTGNITTTKYANLTFSLKNLWTYAIGTYSHTVVFTLSAQ
jgi:hypothetical protein